MKKIFLLYIYICFAGHLFAQATIYPAAQQAESIRIDGATIHIGNGETITNGSVVFDKGVITYVGDVQGAPSSAKVINATGKQLFPGFIAPNTNLGLVEIEAVKATVDFAEIGENNAHVRSIVAYNTDSKVIPTIKFNGILLAQTTPRGGLISGSSSIVQLDAWNWEDAAYKIDDGIHVHWPALNTNRFRFMSDGQIAEAKKQIEVRKTSLLSFVKEAKAYAVNSSDNTVTNARLAAFNKVLDGSSNLYVHVESAKDIRDAVLTFTDLGLKPVLVGASEAHLALDLLKQHDIAVILKQTHRLPSKEDEDVSLPYKQANMLYEAGVLFAFAVDGFWEQRNLPFMAGTAVAYGLPYEEAVKSLSLNTAKILGIDKQTGSIEVGKDANFIVTIGDALDMGGNKLIHAFIQGRNTEVNSLHKQLYDRYNHKYAQ